MSALSLSAALARLESGPALTTQSQTSKKGTENSFECKLYINLELHDASYSSCIAWCIIFLPTSQYIPIIP